MSRVHTLTELNARAQEKPDNCEEKKGEQKNWLLKGFGALALLSALLASPGSPFNCDVATIKNEDWYSLKNSTSVDWIDYSSPTINGTSTVNDLPKVPAGHVTCTILDSRCQHYIDVQAYGHSFGDVWVTGAPCNWQFGLNQTSFFAPDLLLNDDAFFQGNRTDLVTFNVKHGCHGPAGYHKTEIFNWNHDYRTDILDNKKTVLATKVAPTS